MVVLFLLLLLSAKQAHTLWDCEVAAKNPVFCCFAKSLGKTIDELEALGFCSWSTNSPTDSPTTDSPTNSPTVKRTLVLVGYNSHGQLGDGSSTNRATPVEVMSAHQVIQVAMGYQHTVFLTSSNKVYVAGYNYYGQLGIGAATSFTYTPVEVMINEPVTLVAAGYHFSFFLTSTGVLYASGQNDKGQLAIGTVTASEATPLVVSTMSGHTVTQVAAGYQHVMFLTSSGAVYAAGSQQYGQLGDGVIAASSVSTPFLVTSLSGHTVTQIAAGGYHNVFLTSTNRVYTVGYNYFGQLGVGSITHQATPQRIDDLSPLSGHTVTQVAVGYLHTAFISDAGAVFMAGANGDYQLGDGSSTHRPTPVRVDDRAPLSAHTVTQVACGLYHTAILTSAGEMYVVGHNG